MGKIVKCYVDNFICWLIRYKSVLTLPENPSMTKISIELSRFPPAECNKTLTTAWTVYTRHNALSRTGNGIKHRRPSLYRVRIRLHRGQKRHNSQDRLQTRKQKSNKFLFMSAATLKPIRLKCYLAPTK